jgi:hypothetical protein
LGEQARAAGPLLALEVVGPLLAPEVVERVEETLVLNLDFQGNPRFPGSSRSVRHR